MRWIYAMVFILVFVTKAMAETPPGLPSELESGRGQKRPVTAETARPRIDGLTWSLLAADGGARALDAYSTRRMLKNGCNSGLQMAGTSTCNYEQNLPGFIANHPAGIYVFDGATWLSEFTMTRVLIHHHHERLARIVPLIDFLSTTSFAVNNLTLSIGNGVSANAMRSGLKRKRNR